MKVPAGAQAPARGPAHGPAWAPARGPTQGPAQAPAQAPPQAPAQAPQLGQAAVPHLQVANPSLQVVGELRQVLHRPNVLHEDLLLMEEPHGEDGSLDLNQQPSEERLLYPP